jgi:hypothetical protein
MLRFSRLFLGLTILFCFARPLSADRVCCEGDLWLQWRAERREAYVFGYTLGYSRGFAEACGREREITLPKTSNLEDEPVRKCRRGLPDFSKGSIYLVDAVTRFYVHHPAQRDIYITEILDLLGTGKNIGQIHKHNFPAHPYSGSLLKDKSAGGAPLNP